MSVCERMCVPSLGTHLESCWEMNSPGEGMPPSRTHTCTRTHADTRIHSAGMRVPRAGVTGLLALRLSFPTHMTCRHTAGRARETGKKNKHSGVASSS